MAPLFRFIVLITVMLGACHSRTKPTMPADGRPDLRRLDVATGDQRRADNQRVPDWRQDAADSQPALDRGPPLDSGLLCAATGWTQMSSGVTAPLRGVWGAGPSNVYAVGEQATLIRYDGNVWTPLSLPFPWSDPLAAVWGSGPSDIYVTSSWIFRFDGLKWWPVPNHPGAGGAAGAIWGDGPQTIYVTTGLGFEPGQAFAVVYRYDGTTWTDLQLPASLATNASVGNIWGASPKDVFVSATVDGGRIYRFNGQSWTQTPCSPGKPLLHGIWGSGPNDVFVAAGDYVGNGSVVHYDGTTCTQMTGPGTPPLFGVWGAAGNDVYAVGTGGAILHYDGTSWTPMSSGVSWDLTAIWGSSTKDVFAVGSNGTILHLCKK